MRPSVKLYPEMSRLATALRNEILPFWTDHIDALDADDPLRPKLEGLRDGVIDMAYDGDAFVRDYEDAFHGDRRVDLQPGRLRAWLRAARGMEAESEKLALVMLSTLHDEAGL